MATYLVPNEWFNYKTITNEYGKYINIYKKEQEDVFAIYDSAIDSFRILSEEEKQNITTSDR